MQTLDTPRVAEYLHVLSPPPGVYAYVLHVRVTQIEMFSRNLKKKYTVNRVTFQYISQCF